MKPKHHKRRNKFGEKNIEISVDWHPVAVDTSAISVDEFACFGGIEELTDYELIRPDKKGNIVAMNSRSKAISKKKKLKAVNIEHSDRNAVNVDNSDVEDLNTLTKKKKKKKHFLSSKEDTLTENIILKNESACTEDSIDLSAWCNCFVPEPILAALKDLKFDKPTPIQELTLPSAIRDYQDILGAAETGSGKTLAFGIPIVTHILASKEKEKNNSSESLDIEDNMCSSFKDYVADKPLWALILTPTRELAIQVKNHLLAIVKYTDIKVAVVVGGMSTEKQKRILHKGPDIVVATPGRLWELIEEGDPHLNQAPNIRYLVIDEADRMVEKGHFAELTQILDLINGNKAKQRRQTFVFSATLTLVHDLPKRMLLKKRKVKLEQKQKLESLIDLIGMKGKPKVIDITRKTGLVETLTESQITCSIEEKDSYLYYFLLEYPGRTLVFCNSIDCVRRLKNVLDHLNCNPLPLHASMQQRQRLKNLERFSASDTGLLLASDVAARGLDIIGIRHVVHFQVPRTSEIYIHRSGRTARAQNEGFSLMLVEPQEIMFYKRICKEKVLPTFPVDHNIFKIVKERVSLARIIDQLDHRAQRRAAQNRWFVKAAKEMDMDIEGEGLLNDLGDEEEQAQETRKMKSMKKQLEALIKRPILPKTMMGRYPTKSGKLVQLPVKGPGKAVMVVKGDEKSKSSVLSTLKKKLKKREKLL